MPETKIFVVVTCMLMQFLKHTKNLIFGQLLKRHNVLLLCGTHLRFG